MRIVDPRTANGIACSSKSAWIELASGRASDLEGSLGPGYRGEHLPGLGEIWAWGLVDESSDVETTGMLCTGFYPDTESVSVLLSALVDGGALSRRSLEALLRLPSHILSRLRVRSLATFGNVIRVSDRSEAVLETKSPGAARLAELLTRHLVVGSEAGRATASATEGRVLYVEAGVGGRISRAASVLDASMSAAIRVDDWA